MKIALLTAIRQDHLPIDHVYKRLMPNLGLLYLAGYLEKRGLPVELKVFDEMAAVESWRPDIFGISSVTENIEYAKSLAGRAKRGWNPLTILGGVHLTALPKSLPEVFDVGVVGEGEETFFELLQAHQARGTLSSDQLRKIPGVVFHTPAGPHFNGFRKGIPLLDDIPFPERHKHLTRPGMTYMMTSRGCPYTCNFCVIPFTTEGYRMHSPEFVVEEIRSIKTHFPEVKNIRIFDDLYIVDRRRVQKIADLVDAEGLNQDLAFGCWGRANLVDPDMVGALKKMNMRYVAFGAESGSSRVLSTVKPGASVEQNQQAIDHLHENGVQVACSFILGHPLETEDDLWSTYEFIEKNFDKLFDVELNVAIPWPGTELWQQAQSRGLVDPQMDFSPLKEAGFFPNYCTDLYPYLNEKIAPERFDVILADFKKLFWAFYHRNRSSISPGDFSPQKEVAVLQGSDLQL
jgi:Fe-S oxidoreductase